MSHIEIQEIFNEYVLECMESTGCSRAEAEIVVYQSGVMNEYDNEPKSTVYL